MVPLLTILGGAVFIGLFTLTPGNPFSPSKGLAGLVFPAGGAILSDTIRNLLLFLPLGIGIGLVRRPTPRWIAFFALVSLTIEVLQGTVIPGRTSSLADIVANMAGGTAGQMMGHFRGLFLTPTRRGRIVLASAWTVLHGTLALTALSLFKPVVAPTAVWWGQWAHTFPSSSPLPGSIRSFDIDGDAVPDGAVAHTDQLRSHLAAGEFRARFQFTLNRSLPADGPPAQLVALADGAGGRIFEVNGRGTGFEVGVLRHASRIGLTVPALFFPLNVNPPPMDVIAAEVTVERRLTRLGVGWRSVAASHALELGALDLLLMIDPSRAVSPGRVRVLRGLWLVVIVGPIFFWLQPFVGPGRARSR